MQNIHIMLAQAAGNTTKTNPPIDLTGNLLKPAIQSYRNSDNYPQAFFQMAKCHRKLKQFNEALTLYK